MLVCCGGSNSEWGYDITVTFRTAQSQTPAADHRLQRASHHGHLTDPDKEPTMAIVGSVLLKTAAARYSVILLLVHTALQRVFFIAVATR
jgi:hypothetical protein